MKTQNVVKAGRPLIDVAKLCYAANKPLLITGLHGVGKSELLEAAATEMGIGYVCRDLSLMEPPDLIGLPEKNGKTTKYLPPDFLPTTGKGLLVFEELNRCERYMRGPCLQLLTARCLNDYRLPPGWLPAAAINPDDLGYEVAALDAAMLSRFVGVTVVSDRDYWLEWARQHGVHRAVVAYVENDSTAFDQPECNPRAWKFASDLLLAAETKGADPWTVQVTLEGLLGNARAAALWKSLQGGGLGLMPEDILCSYSRHRSRVETWITNGRLDLVDASLRQLMKKLQVKAKFVRTKNTASEWANLGKFLSDLPGDLKAKAGELFAERGYEFPALPKRRKRKL